MSVTTTIDMFCVCSRVHHVL